MRQQIGARQGGAPTKGRGLKEMIGYFISLEVKFFLFVVSYIWLLICEIAAILFGSNSFSVPLPVDSRCTFW